MSIKAVIFDVGGVLHSSEIKYVRQDIKQTLQLSDTQFKTIYSRLIVLPQTGEITEDEFWHQVIKEAELKVTLPEESLFQREYKKRFQPHNKVLLFVKSLKQAGYKLAVLSDTIPTHYRINQEKGIYDDFEVKTFSFQVGCKKPHPEIYMFTLDRLQVNPNEAIFIDDKKEYVIAAQQLGIYGVQFHSQDQAIADVKSLLHKTNLKSAESNL